MDEENPYRPPAESWKRADVPLSEELYSPRSCPYCLAEVTFWSGLKQVTPFRYKCPRCKSKCRVRSPRMWLINAGVCCGVCLLGVAVGVGMVEYGFIVLLAAAPLFITVWMALEMWTHQYISRNGVFVVMRTGDQWHVPDPAAEPVSSGESSPPVG